MLRYYPPAAQCKLGSRWVGPQQVIRQATGHPEGTGRPNYINSCGRFKVMSGPRDVAWTTGLSTAKSLCASTVAFQPGSHISETASTPSVDVSAWNTSNTRH